MSNSTPSTTVELSNASGGRLGRLASLPVFLRRESTQQRLIRKFYRAFAIPDLMQGRPKWLILMSHMRSGSSLLSQILASHPEICGYGETHTNMDSIHSLDVVLGKIIVITHRWPGLLRERYAFDKIVFNPYLLPESVQMLCLRRPRFVFLIREPRATLKSLLNFEYPKRDEKAVIEYYTERLDNIARNAVEVSKYCDAVAVTYNQILDETEAALGLISQYLQLKEPLQEEYDITHTVGRYRSGDPSPNLLAGKILRSDRKGSDAPILPSPEALTESQAAYDHCWSVLQQHCRTLDYPTADR